MVNFFTKNWVKFGLGWGLFMLFMLNVIFPLLDGGGISWQKILIGLPVWLAFGLIFGYVSRKKEPKNNDE